MFVARCVLGSILDRLGCLFIFGEYQGLFSSWFNSNLNELYVVAYSGVTSLHEGKEACSPPWRQAKWHMMRGTAEIEAEEEGKKKQRKKKYILHTGSIHPA